MNSTNTYHKPKLFVVLSRFPFPIDKGDKLRAFYQLRDLSKDWDIYLHCLSEFQIAPENIQKVEIYCKELHIHQLKKYKTFINCAWQILGNKPFQVAYFFQKQINRKIQAALLKTKPDHIFCQLVRSAEYVKNYHNCPKTIDYMDALNEGMKRRSLTSKFIFKAFFKSEWKRLLRYENLIFDYFEIHTIISEQDRQLMPHTLKNKIQIVPNGVGEHFFEYLAPTEKKYDLVFIGNLSYPPNIKAVEFIANELIPLAEKRNHNWKVLVAGATPNARILNCKSKSLTIKDWTEDIRENYAAGKIFIAPMFIGTGLQNKLLESMAMGLPSITTPLAGNVFNTSKNELLIAENALEFIEHIEHLITDADFYNSVAEQGKEFILEHFEWKKINQTLSDKMLASLTPNNA